MEPQIIPRIDPKSILQAFLRDIKVKMPSVCGLPLQFCDQAKYTKNVMAEATLQVHLLSGNTLTSEPPQTSKRLPTRSLNSIPKAVHPSYRVGQLTEPNPAAERLDPTMHPQTKSVLPNPPTTNRTFNENSQASCSAFRVPFSFQDELQDKSDVDSGAQRGMNFSRRVLMFQPRDIPTGVQHIQQPTNPIVPGPRIVPTFKPTKTKSLLASKKFSSTKSSHQTKHVESIRKVQDFDSARSTTLIQRVPTRGQPVESNKTLAATAICNSSSASMYVASCTPSCAASSGPECAISYAPSTFNASRGVAGFQTCSPTGHNPVRISQTEVTASRNDIDFQQSIPQVGSSSAMMISASAGNPEESFPALHQEDALQVPEINSSHPQKRAQEVCNSNQAVKRAKTCPTQIQPSVELMAVNDQLHKVNAMTLSTWLKGKNIYVKSREKKADLIQKVLNFITAQKSEN